MLNKKRTDLNSSIVDVAPKKKLYHFTVLEFGEGPISGDRARVWRHEFDAAATAKSKARIAEKKKKLVKILEGSPASSMYKPEPVQPKTFFQKTKDAIVSIWHSIF